MRLIVFLLILLAKPVFGQEQAVVWTKGIEINLEENEIWNVDIMNNLILTRRNIIEKYEQDTFTIEFGYTVMNEVMKILKDENPEQSNQQFDNVCNITLATRKEKAEGLRNMLENVDGLTIL